MLRKKIFTFFITICIISVGIAARVEKTQLIQRCQEALTEQITHENLESVIDLIKTIKRHENDYFNSGYYRDVRASYEKLLEKLGDYYWQANDFHSARGCYKEASRCSISGNIKKYRQRIKDCNEETDKKDIPAEDCKKIVFIVDLSYLYDYNLAAVLINVVGKVYDEYWNIGKNDFYLITFSKWAESYSTDECDEIEKIIEKIKSDSEKSTRDKSPKTGLSTAFDLVAEGFPKKTGIVLFISSGKDSRGSSPKIQKDLGTTIQALKHNGFTVFCIFIDTGKNTQENRQFIKNLARYAETKPLEIKDIKQINSLLSNLKQQVESTGFCGPVSRKKYEKFIEAVKIKDIIIILLGVTAFGLILWVIFGKKPEPPHSPKKEIRLDMLWGKLDPRDKKFAVINLGEKPLDYELDHSKNFNNLPNLKFFPDKHQEKKVIKVVRCGKGEVECLDKSKNPIDNNNDYIDAHTAYIKVISPEDANISHEYSYIFLDKLDEVCKKPVWEENDFKGREEICQEIKDNFLDEINCHNYLIYGMGNSGKTSLMKHLYHIVLGKDDAIMQKYVMVLVEFKINQKFSELEKEIYQKLGACKKGQKKLVLIDEYDKIFENEICCEDFRKFIKENSTGHQCFYIFSGRKGEVLLEEEKWLDVLPKYIKFKKLGSFDKTEAILAETYEKSPEFLEFLLEDIGFPSTALDPEVKRRIISYASGFPSLIKEILFELLDDWLTHYEKHPIQPAYVDEAVNKIKVRSRDFLLTRAYAFEARYYNNLGHIPVTDVRIREIMECIIRDFKGTADKETIRNILGRYRGDKKIELERLKSFDNKIKQLEDMGFITESQGKLIGVPSLIFKEN